MDNEDRKECQICERKIKAKNGYIAHHGYQRPGMGWQTSSCPGAKKLPYEVSCDLIPPVIKGIEAYIKETSDKSSAMISNPPKTITAFAHYPHDRNAGEVYDKPENFDPHARIGGYWGDQMYEFEFAYQIKSMAKSVEQCKFDLSRLNDRVKNWVYKG